MNATDRGAAVSALRSAAGALVRPEVLTIRVTGADRVRFLNGMLSNDVAKLAPGEAQRAVKASSKGRVEGVLRVRRRAEEVLLDVREVSAARVAGELVKFVVMDDVTLHDASSERQVLSVHGPRAAEILTAAGFGAPPSRNLTFVEGEGLTVVRDDEYGIEGYELHVADAEAALERLAGAGAQRVTLADLDVVRIEAGRPLDGVDIGEDTIPLEARLYEAVDPSKGCYIGQEVIARATLRGGVKHRLVGLAFEGTLPPAGAELFVEGGDRRTGEVTSSVTSPTLGRAIGLGYVHVDHEAPGTHLEARWADGSAKTEVVELPHVP